MELCLEIQTMNQAFRPGEALFFHRILKENSNQKQGSNYSTVT